MVALQALRNCVDNLEGYTIVFYSVSEDVRIAAELFRQETNLKVEIFDQVNHEEILQLFGKARIYIGLSISDGISTSLLEAMAMGTFPIQSCTACANEWIEHGKSGLIVPPENSSIITEAIKLALSNDSLVNKAAELNLYTIKSD